MAKKKIESAAGAAAEVKTESPAVEAKTEAPAVSEEQSKAARVTITTTAGKTINNVNVFGDKELKVGIAYGTIDPEAKGKEKYKDMKNQMSRSLTEAQAARFISLGGMQSEKALEYAAKAAFPMFVDDKKFKETHTQVNGRDVNYIVVKKLTKEDLGQTPEEQEANKHLEGRWQLSMGIKDDKSSRFVGLMSSEEVAMLRHRAEPILDKDGKIKGFGAPVTLADIAAKVENRVLARRNEREANTKAAKSINWGKYAIPEGANVEKLRYFDSKDPSRVVLTGTVNGIQVSGLLSKNETTGVREKIATLQQALMANSDLSKKVNSIVKITQAAKATEEAAVSAVVERTKDATAKSFTPEQRKAIDAYTAGLDTPEDRQFAFDVLMSKAGDGLAGTNEKWIEDVKQELSDLAKGVERSEEQTRSMSR